MTSGCSKAGVCNCRRCPHPSPFGAGHCGSHPAGCHLYCQPVYPDYPGKKKQHRAAVFPLALIDAGWRRCPDGSWRLPSAWPALVLADPPFSCTVLEQARSENCPQGSQHFSQDHPPFSGVPGLGPQ
jgi:hypothetical protein